MSNLDSFAELSGISQQNCASFCHADHCVVSGDGTCAHPLKSGLQRPGQRSPEVLKRYDEACQILGVKNKFEVTE